jgi:hypothetical protein
MSMLLRYLSWLSFGLVTACLSPKVQAPEPEAAQFRFPADARVIDVTQPPYGATPDDEVDDTEAIQRALADHSGKNAIIYFPNGRYLLSDTLALPKPWKRTILQGESQRGAILQLQDQCPGFQDTLRPRAMYRSSRVGFSADAFRNGIRSLTFDVGRGNPAAIGVQFFASNQGRMDRVSIRSQDGQGRIGLDLGYNRDNGPALLTYIDVEGFDYGIHFTGEVNSMTLEHVSLRGQGRYGIYNAQQVMNIRDLRSDNQVPALCNVDSGVVTLLDAELMGGAGDHAAIVNEGWLYLRGVESQGYVATLDSRVGEGKRLRGPIQEYFSHGAPAAAVNGYVALNLPVKEAPAIPWGDPATWTNLEDYGAVSGDTLDDAAALQAAIDATTGTVYVPNGDYRINDTVYLRGQLHRLIGCEARVEGRGALVIEGGSAPALIIERLNHGYYRQVPLLHRSDQTLILSSLIWTGDNIFTGTGDLFLEDVVGGDWRFLNPKQHIWARQFDTEGKDTFNVVNQGATLWMLGYKTERSHVKVVTTQGGKTEILGAHIYGNLRPKEGAAAKARPIYLAQEATLSLINQRHICFTGFWVDHWVVSAEGGQADTLRAGGSFEVFNYITSTRD